MHRFKFYKSVFNLTFSQNNSLNNYVRNLVVPQIRSVSNYEAAESSDESITSNFRKPGKILKLDEFDEKSFLVRHKNDPDTFGDPAEHETIDEGDILEDKHFTEQVEPSKKLSTKRYASMIKDLIEKRKIKEAVNILEERMLKDDKVKPENYIYNLILGALGQVGYTKKAFSLFNRMKERGLQVHISTYTSLFNACANSPFPTQDRLERARKLREMMIEKGVQPNDSVYNAMIKAFGRVGELNTAFSIVDEMYKRKFPVKVDTINFLLQACISDKEAGFRHALLVWRKMMKKKIRPNVYSYNLLLRCVRDCGLGDLEVTEDVIKKLVADYKGVSANTETKVIAGNNEPLFLAKNDEMNHENLLKGNDMCKLTLFNVEGDFNKLYVGTMIETTEKHSTFDENVNKINKIEDISISGVPKSLANYNDPRPNLLAKKPHLGNIIALSEVTKAEDRLLLLGGYTGFLKNMSDSNCQPNIKTFTQLLECMPNSTPLEKDLILNMSQSEIQADIDFFNILMKKRSMRFDYEGAREVLKVMEKMRYKPDVITYGVLALGCTDKERALELIKEMQNHSYSLNAEIMGTLVAQGCYHGNFEYVSEIMDVCLKENVCINKKFKEHLDKLKRRYRYQMNSGKLSKSQEKKFVTWKAKYKVFLEQIRMDDTEDLHPWQQFETERETEHKFKWRKESKFKPRRISRFKVKTSTKVRY